MSREIGNLYHLRNQWQLEQWKHVLNQFEKLHKGELKGLLDLGCGNGDLTIESINHLGGVEFALGLDNSGEMIGEAKKRHKEFARNFLVANIEDLVTKSSDKKFDLIMSNFSFHWIQDKPKVLKGLTKSVSDHGYLIIGTCERMPRIFAEIDEAIRRQLGQERRSPYYYMGHEEWKIELARGGWSTRKVIRARDENVVPATVQFFQDWWQASQKKVFYGKEFYEMDFKFLDDLIGYLNSKHLAPGTFEGNHWRYYEDTLFLIAEYRP